MLSPAPPDPSPLRPAPPDLTPHATGALPGLRRAGRRRLKRTAAIPAPRPDNLRLATWNIRELGKSPRWDDSIALLAAIIARFDLVSVVELRDDLGDLRRILHRLGPRWSAVFSDYHLDAGATGSARASCSTPHACPSRGWRPARRRPAPGRGTSTPWRCPGGARPSWPPSPPAACPSCWWPRMCAGAGRCPVARPRSRRWPPGRRAAAPERFFQAQNLALVGDFNLPSQRSWVWKTPPASPSRTGRRPWQQPGPRQALRPCALEKPERHRPPHPPGRRRGLLPGQPPRALSRSRADPASLHLPALRPPAPVVRGGLRVGTRISRHRGLPFGLGIADCALSLRHQARFWVARKPWPRWLPLA